MIYLLLDFIFFKNRHAAGAKAKLVLGFTCNRQDLPDKEKKSKGMQALQGIKVKLNKNQDLAFAEKLTKWILTFNILTHNYSLSVSSLYLL
jgi:hypothetical protein